MYLWDSVTMQQVLFSDDLRSNLMKRVDFKKRTFCKMPRVKR